LLNIKLGDVLQDEWRIKQQGGKAPSPYMPPTLIARRLTYKETE
jgi:hypothetical protein